MRSRLRSLSDVTKMVVASFIIGALLAVSIGYTVDSQAGAGCHATHAVIRNLDDYFELQIHRIESPGSVYATQPAARAKALRGYRGVIAALGHVTCN